MAGNKGEDMQDSCKTERERGIQRPSPISCENVKSRVADPIRVLSRVPPFYLAWDLVKCFYFIFYVDPDSPH